MDTTIYNQQLHEQKGNPGVERDDDKDLHLKKKIKQHIIIVVKRRPDWRGHK